jgi:hypothetical protein
MGKWCPNVNVWGRTPIDIPYRKPLVSVVQMTTSRLLKTHKSFPNVIVWRRSGNCIGVTLELVGKGVS